jgi:cell division FtsZ-interacting protein ZapD
LDKKDAIFSYQYGEKIKSCLIIATKLLDRMTAMSGESMLGAQELFKAYLEFLTFEIRIAINTAKAEPLAEAEKKLREAIRNVEIGEFNQAIKLLSEALSKTTTCCQRAMTTLKDEKLI